ncbi:MAG: hypothetical protein ACJ763_09075 [Bdellovibrionia bacterium]
MDGKTLKQRKLSLTPYRPLLWGMEFILLLGFWFMLTAKVNFQEFCAGALTTLVSLFAVHLCVEVPFSRLSNIPRYIFQIWRIPLSIPSGLYQVFSALFLALFSCKGQMGAKQRSDIQAIPFEPGAADDPEAEFRRTLALTLPTCTPNFVAIDIERDQGLYIFHQVKNAPPPQLLLKLRSEKPKNGEAP